MKFNHKIQIDMLEFLKTGKFDYLEIGQTQGWILNNFPEPDNYVERTKFQKGVDIWLYGKIELHFYDEKLQMIFSDHFQSDIWGKDFHAGEAIDIKPWLFEHPKDLTLLYVMKQLNAQAIDFKKVTTQWYIHLVLQSGVVLGFYDENGENKLHNYNDYLMQTFHYPKKPLW